MAPNQVVENYLSKARTAFSQYEQLPTAQQLLELGDQVGMNESDWSDAHQQSLRLSDDGRQLLAKHDYDDAIDRFLMATLLTPERLEPMHLLAKAYTERWRATGEQTSRALAAELSRRCILLAAEHIPSQEILAQTQSVEPSGDDDGEVISWGKAALLVFVLVVVSSTIMTCAQYLVDLGS